MSRYDRLPFVSLPRSDTQCRRLEAMAALSGLSPSPPARARVLDLGCGTADNLAYQATEYRDARFVGCDSSATAIATGRRMIQDLGLDNVELRHQDLSEVDTSWGTFDYIICHGVFSWVPPAIRRRILEIFRHHLTPDGVGLVSYNVSPGWSIRSAVRDLMRRYTRGIDDPLRAVTEACDILGLAAESHTVGGPLGPLLSREHILMVAEFDETYLYHEMLAEDNHPFYFEEFLDQTEQAGLQYVTATDIATTFAWDLPAKPRAFLETLPSLEREHYLDYFRGIMLRYSIICHSEATVDRRLDPRSLERFAVRLTRPARVDSNPADGQVASLVIGKCALPCPDSATLAVIRHLDAHRPHFIPVRELSQCAPSPSTLPHGTKAVQSDAGDRMLSFLLDAVTAGAVEPVLSPPRIAERVSDRPTVNLMARFQVHQGRRVTNQHQDVVMLGPASRFLAPLLDGTRDRGALTAMVRHALKEGRLALDSNGDPDPERIIDTSLDELCREALLIA